MSGDGRMGKRLREEKRREEKAKAKERARGWG
jgi:hypothetical protein